MLKHAEKATLTPAFGLENISGATTWKLEVGGETFKVVSYNPGFPGARPTLVVVESTEQDVPQEERVLFHAKQHRQGKEMLFLKIVDGSAVIYRIIGGWRNPHVDEVWTVTEEGVSCPDLEQSIMLKGTIAALEMEEFGNGCQVELTAKERAYQLVLQRQREAAKAEERQRKLEAERQAAKEKDFHDRLAREQREAEKAERISRLRSNTRCFTSQGGKLCSGSVVVSEQEAQMLKDGEWVVFLDQSGRVVRAAVVQKNRGGRVALSDVPLAEDQSSKLAASGQQRLPVANQKPALRAFGMFQRPQGKRRDGDQLVKAFYVTAEELLWLKDNRPEEPVTVVMQEGFFPKSHSNQRDRPRYHVWTIAKEGVTDRGFMEKRFVRHDQVSDGKPAAPAKKSRFKKAA